MLQKLNERIQGIFAWVIIVLVALTFTMFGVDYYMQSRQNTNYEVMVNDTPITKQAFEASYRRSRQQHDLSQLTSAVEKQIKDQVLNDLIINTVMVQAAQKNGFDVTPDQAIVAIQSIPQFQEDGRFSVDRFEQALNGAFFTPETFQKEVRQGMLLNQQRFAFMGTSFVLPSEVKRFVKLYMQTRDYNVLTISAKKFMDQVSVTPEEVETYYKSHHDNYMTDEQVQVSYVSLSLPEVKKDIQISDDELKQYYQENESNYTTPARWQVAHILFALPPNASEPVEKDAYDRATKTYDLLKADPSKFAEYAKKVSDDKISGMNEGKLPWLVAGQTEFDEALSSLTEPGQLSLPVKTRHGYEIFKLLNYKPAETKPFDAVKNEIREQLVVELAQAKFAEALEELTDVSYQSPDSLTPVALALKLKVNQSEPFGRNGLEEGLASNRQLVKTAFSRDVLELGNNSDPIQLDSETVVVLRVLKHIPSKPMPLEEVRTEIQKRLKFEKATQMAAALGQQLEKQGLSQEEAAKLLADHQLKWVKHTKMARDSDGVSTDVSDLAFGVAHVGMMQGRTFDNGNYVIVELDKINNGQMVDLDKEQQINLALQIESNLGVMDYDLYLNSEMKKAVISNH